MVKETISGKIVVFVFLYFLIILPQIYLVILAVNIELESSITHQNRRNLPV